MEGSGGGYPSGRWRGYYVQNGHPDWMSLGLTFEDGWVGGIGEDHLGPFLVTGGYKVNGNVEFLKQYIAAHAVDYEGRPSGSGIAGRWRIGAAGGTFRIWPCTQSGAEEELVEERQAEDGCRLAPERLTVEASLQQSGRCKAVTG